MPEISFFLDEHDTRLLLDRLNADQEIAFIVPDGPTPVAHGIARIIAPTSHVGAQRWRAVRAVEALEDGDHSLWHVPAGPLPLIPVPSGGVVGRPYPPIPDPWAGWTAPPGFGPGCHPWIRLEVWTRHRSYTQQERAALRELISFWMEEHDQLVVSGFQWTGGHFSPAPPQTQQWWNRMRRWVEKTAMRLHAKPGFWAFPSALQKLKGGMQYYSRNYNLDEGIRVAETPRSK
jgi:hypothetical protein